MGASVTLEVIKGSMSGRQFSFRERSTCLIGRADDCDIRLLGGQNPSYVSRYHCLLDIQPPNAYVRDYHSKNGTFLNNRAVGQHNVALNNGDELKVGDTLFRVVIEQVEAPQNLEPTQMFNPETHGESTLLSPSGTSPVAAPEPPSQRRAKAPARAPADSGSSFNPKYFGFRRKPFQGSGLDFLRAYADYETAYARLLDSIRLGHKLIVLTGEAGTGKSLLLGNLVHDPTVGLTSVLCKSPTGYDEILAWICDDLGLTVAGHERPHKLQALMEYGKSHPGQGIVLIIDNARQLDSASMSGTLRLSRLGLVATTVLADTPGLTHQLSHVGSDAQGAERNVIAPLLSNATHVDLRPLSSAQTAEFIQRQLQVAGGSETLFAKPAIERVALLTQGIPRTINALCNRGLRIAEAEGQRIITEETINQAAVQLDLMEPTTHLPLAKRVVNSPSPPDENDIAIIPGGKGASGSVSSGGVIRAWLMVGVGVVIMAVIALGFWLYAKPPGG